MQFKRRQRTAAGYVAAFLSFALAQLAAAAHAENCHHDHDAEAPCVICCLAAVDDDNDALKVDADLDMNRIAERKDIAGLLQVVVVRPEALAFVRGPPLS